MLCELCIKYTIKYIFFILTHFLFFIRKDIIYIAREMMRKKVFNFLFKGIRVKIPSLIKQKFKHNVFFAIDAFENQEHHFRLSDGVF